MKSLIALSFINLLNAYFAYVNLTQLAPNHNFKLFFAPFIFIVPVGLKLQKNDLPSFRYHFKTYDPTSKESLHIIAWGLTIFFLLTNVVLYSFDF